MFLIRIFRIALIIISLALCADTVFAYNDLYNRFRDVEVNLNALEPGQMVTVSWGWLPVIILKRTNKQIEEIKINRGRNTLASNGEYWRDSFVKAYSDARVLPNILMLDQVALEKTVFRSFQEDIFVALPIAPLSGCFIRYEGYKENSKAVFFDACYLDSFDAAGRILKGGKSGKPWNMYIPPHHYVGKDKLVLGLGNPARDIPNIDFSPDIDYSSLSPIRQLYEAINNDRLDIVKNLIDKGLSVNTIFQFNYSPDKTTPLQLAALKGNKEIIEYLLNNGANYDYQAECGVTAVHFAIWGYHPELIKLLHSHGADINKICSRPECMGTPLNMAINFMPGEEEIQIATVKLLIELGADPYIKFNGENAFDLANKSSLKKILPILKQQ